MDWCNTEGMHPRDAYGNMSAAMNATGRPMHLNMCEWGREQPWEWGGQIAQSWRMAGDHTGRWADTKAKVRASAAIPAKWSGRAWAWNDMDMLESGYAMEGPRIPRWTPPPQSMSDSMSGSMSDSMSASWSTLHEASADSP